VIKDVEVAVTVCARDQGRFEVDVAVTVCARDQGRFEVEVAVTVDTLEPSGGANV